MVRAKLLTALVAGSLVLAPSATYAHSGISNWYTNPQGGVHCSSARFTSGSGTISAWIQTPFTQGAYKPVNVISSACISPTYSQYGYSAAH